MQLRSNHAHLQNETLNSTTPSTSLSPTIENARRLFAALLKMYVPVVGASQEQYHRYLTMQYHLTREVQTYFITAAAHRDLARKRQLRKFLFEFGNEEELHYLVAANDLAALGMTVGDIPIDVVLWHSYFRAIVATKPFIRLGAACILENISDGVARSETQRALGAPFLNRSNSKFLVLHHHETLPHGNQLLAALDAAQLSEDQLRDLAYGASVGTVLYLRMAEWALDPATLSAIADATFAIDPDDGSRIQKIQMNDGLQVSLYDR